MGKNSWRTVEVDDLGDEPVMPAPVPQLVAPSPTKLRIAQVAPNPENRREYDPAKVAELAADIARRGQLQASTLVTRQAFLAIFPEHEAAIGNATHVQVMGARRRDALIMNGAEWLKVDVQDHLASSRAEFIAATAAENLQREDFNPIEEARQIEALVAEVHTNKAAAERLGKTAPYVTQRLNLLKLVPEVQTVLKTGELSVSRARKWHESSPAEQLALLAAWRGAGAPTEEMPSAAKKTTKAKPEHPEHPVNQVKVQLWGTAAACDQAVAALRADLKVLDVSPWRSGGATAGGVPLGRMHVDVRVDGSGERDAPTGG